MVEKSLVLFFLFLLYPFFFSLSLFSHETDGTTMTLDWHVFVFVKRRMVRRGSHTGLTCLSGTIEKSRVKENEGLWCH